MALTDDEVGYSSLPGRPNDHDSEDAEDEIEDDEFPKLTMRVEGGQSSLSSVFTLCNSAIGAGILALPASFKFAGLVGGILLTLVLGAAMGFTLFVLVRFSEYYRAHTYQGLVRRAFGKKMAMTTATILGLYLFGGCIVYLIIIGDTFTNLTHYYFGTGWWSDRRIVIAITGTFVALPMCYPKRLGKLSGFSAIAVAGFLYTSAAVLVQGFSVFAGNGKHRMDGVKLFHTDTSFLNAIPMIVFGFQCHTNVVTIYQELAPRPSFTIGSSAAPHVTVVPADSRQPPRRTGSGQPNTPKLLGMKAIVSLAITLIMTGYLAVGTAGYLAYPTTVASNVLNTFPEDDIIMQVARFMIGIVVITHYPVNHHPARSAIEDLLRHAFGLRPFTRPWRYLQTTVFYFLTLAVAVFVSDLGNVIHLIGGTAAGLLTFGIPGLLLINSYIDIRVWVKTGDHEKAQALQAELLAKRGEQPDVMPQYSNSWLIGVACLVANAFIFCLTIYTAIVPPAR